MALKVDQEGRVYAAVAQGVWVFEPDGSLLGILETPKRPANLAWCDRDAQGLAITAVRTPSITPVSKSPAFCLRLHLHHETRPILEKIGRR